MRTTVKQQNVMRFFGVTNIKGVLFSVSEYCSKGVLRDILEVIQTRGLYICYVTLFFICLYSCTIIMNILLAHLFILELNLL